MIAVDTNLRDHAHREHAPWHDAALDASSGIDAIKVFRNGTVITPEV